MDLLKSAASYTVAAACSPVGKTVALTGAVVAAPATSLWALGFSCPGIIGGSWAASWMSSGVATGALAAAQSAGAAGLSTTTYGALSAAGLYVSKKLFFRE